MLTSQQAASVSQNKRLLPAVAYCIGLLKLYTDTIEMACRSRRLSSRNRYNQPLHACPSSQLIRHDLLRRLGWLYPVFVSEGQVLDCLTSSTASLSRARSSSACREASSLSTSCSASLTATSTFSFAASSFCVGSFVRSFVHSTRTTGRELLVGSSGRPTRSSHSILRWCCRYHGILNT